MKGSAQRILLLLMTISIAVACSQEKGQTASEEELKAEMRRDSAALHVAIYPSEVCLPFYFAEAADIYKEMGVDIRFSHLNAMESCDTALMNHRVEVAATDLARLLVMKKHKLETVAIGTMSNHLMLLTATDKKIKDIKQLKERIIAIERHSEVDYLSDVLAEKAGLENLDLFRTQFNEHKTREEMLSSCQLDAAFLDQPFAAFSQIQGAKHLWPKEMDIDSWNVLATSKKTAQDETRSKQIMQLIEGYNAAVEMLNKGDLRHLSDSLLVHAYNLPRAAVDTLTSIQPCLIGFKAIRETQAASLKTAKEWLVKRGQIDEALDANDMIENKYLNRQK